MRNNIQICIYFINRKKTCLHKEKKQRTEKDNSLLGNEKNEDSCRRCHATVCEQGTLSLPHNCRFNALIFKMVELLNERKVSTETT